MAVQNSPVARNCQDVRNRQKNPKLELSQITTSLLKIIVCPNLLLASSYDLSMVSERISLVAESFKRGNLTENPLQSSFLSYRYSLN